MSDFSIDDRNKVRRGAHRADYDRDTVYSIIDEALYCDVGFVQDGLPFVIPTNHARVGDRLYLHGAPVGRKMKVMESGAPLCITFTLLDGLVLGKTAASHSVNYRSAIVFGKGVIITDPGEKLAALEAIVEHVIPGRLADAAPPTEKEVAGTAVVAVDIESASAKVRTGPPGASDSTEPVWAGVLPIRLEFMPPTPADGQDENVELPDYISGYWRGKLSLPDNTR